MAECAELGRAARIPAAFHGCVRAMGGGGAIGIVRPPITLPDQPVAGAATFKGPIIVDKRDTDLDAPALPTRRRRSRPKPHHQEPARRVARAVRRSFRLPSAVGALTLSRQRGVSSPGFAAGR